MLLLSFLRTILSPSLREAFFSEKAIKVKNRKLLKFSCEMDQKERKPILYKQLEKIVSPYVRQRLVPASAAFLTYYTA